MNVNKMTVNKEVALEIKDIFDKNTLDDLKRFLDKRQCLNVTNTYLIYLFHLVQSSGILVTSIAAGSNDKNLVWIGVALNILATLINVYEKMNTSIMKKLMNDIKAIKSGVYVDEGELVETDKKHATDDLVSVSPMKDAITPGKDIVTQVNESITQTIKTPLL